MSLMNIFSRFQEDAFAFCIDCHTLLGVAGIDMSLTPISERAIYYCIDHSGGGSYSTNFANAFNA